jgi:hypothetical protein
MRDGDCRWPCVSEVAAPEDKHFAADDGIGVRAMRCGSGERG